MMASWAAAWWCPPSPPCAPTAASVYLGGEICHAGVDVFSSSTEGKHQTCQLVGLPYLPRPLTFTQPVPSSCPAWRTFPLPKGGWVCRGWGFVPVCAASSAGHQVL